MNTPADTMALAQGYWKSPLEEFGLGVIGACRGPGRGRLGQVVVVLVMHLPFPGVISKQWPCFSIGGKCPRGGGSVQGAGDWGTHGSARRGRRGERGQG